jgi:hypothetical protein
VTTALGAIRERRNGTLPVAAVAVLLAYGAFATLFEPWGRPISIITAVAIVALACVALIRGWHLPGRRLDPPERVPRSIPALLVWAVLLAALTFVQLFNFWDWPRDVYPTLSSLAGRVFSVYPVRALAYGMWLWLGWYLVDR